jgi:hypothetical protein
LLYAQTYTESEMDPEIALADMLRIMYKLDIIDFVSLDTYVDILQLRLFERH